MAPQRLSRPARGLEALPHLGRKTKFLQVSSPAGTNPEFSERLGIRPPVPVLWSLGREANSWVFRLLLVFWSFCLR